MTAELLRDLIDIPERVHAGDFVLTLNKGVTQASTITDYVVTPQLARCFDDALGLVQSAVESRASRAAYLDGSFGSGKSHFMAVLHAILSGNPEARGKTGLVEVVARHDKWLAGRKFLLVPYHMIEAASLESAILGGYVRHVAELRPDAPLPAVYRDEGLLADARDLRAALGDERFIAGLPGDSDDEWGAPWTPTSLDAALAAPPGDSERKRLVGDLLASHFTRYAQAVSGTAESFIELDKGLAEISRHARDVLGCDAVVLLLDELVLWLSSYIGDTTRIQAEAQKVSKLVESAEHERPAPIVSFVPRQRDLRELVGRDVAGATTASLFDTLKYWDGRFDRIKLEDSNLPVVVEARLLRPKDAAAKAAIDAAFQQTEQSRPEVWDALLDAQGGPASRADFRGTYPFSPAFLHAMVDVSGALQRQRTALKLMQQLLVDYRDTLRAAQDKVGRLEVLATDLPVLRRIANPLQIATVGEVLVLRDDWKLLIERRAAGEGPVAELKAGDIRRWIADEQPGLPALVSDLLIACFAVQSDRAWFRAGQPVLPPPEIGRITPEMVLRRQELPGDEEFALAGERAGGVFGLGSQPVRSARAVQALAAELRSRAGSLLPAAESLVAELGRHASMLGLAADSPRLVTARTAAELLNRLTGLADSTALVRALAASDLPREGAVYRASLASAAELTSSLSRVRWEILDRLAATADGGGAKAESATSFRDQLTSAARHDEQQVPLRGALDQAERDAINLLIEVSQPPAELLGPETAASSRPQQPAQPRPADPGTITRRVSARDVAAVAEEICETADKNPEASFDISWRIVTE